MCAVGLTSDVVVCPPTFQSTVDCWSRVTAVLVNTRCVLDAWSFQTALLSISGHCPKPTSGDSMVCSYHTSKDSLAMSLAPLYVHATQGADAPSNLRRPAGAPQQMGNVTGHRVGRSNPSVKRKAKLRVGRSFTPICSP